MKTANLLCLRTPDLSDIISALSYLLEQRGIMSAEDIAARLDSNHQLVQHALNTLVTAGRVEVIPPIGPTTGKMDLTYYRWRKTTDCEHRWQTTVQPRSFVSSHLMARPMLSPI